MTEKRVVESLDEITPSWLTRVLSEDGALRDGEVESIQIQGLQERELSTSAQLRLTYLPTSTGQLPTKLFLKMVKTAYDEDDPLLATEVDYYARDYVGVQGAPMSVYVASEWCRGGMNLDTKRYWMPMLRGALTACDDLGSADLWREN